MSPPYGHLFHKFLSSNHTLRVYKGNRLVFTSDKDRLQPLVEYIERYTPCHQKVTIFDKVVGHAAALLCAKAGCKEIYSPLGSQLAIETLDRYGIRYHLTKIVPYIQKPDQKDMCPMERLSIGKQPEEFYRLVRRLSSKARIEGLTRH